MILILLSCFINCLWANNVSDTSTGLMTRTDTAKATVPIYVIKQANIKLNERLYLLEIVDYQNQELEYYKTINCEYDSLLNEANKVISTYHDASVRLDKEVQKEKNKNKYLTYGIIGAITASIISILTMSLSR